MADKGTTETRKVKPMSLDEVDKVDSSKRKGLDTVGDKRQREDDEDQPAETKKSPAKSSKSASSPPKSKSKQSDDAEAGKDEASKDTEDRDADEHTDKKHKAFENSKEDEVLTGAGEKATNAQKDFIEVLEGKTDETVDTSKMDRAAASQAIDHLKSKADENEPSALEADKTPQAGTHLAKPKEWATGEEAATEKQGRYLAVLEKKAGEKVDGGQGLSKGEASEKIQELKGQTGA